MNQELNKIFNGFGEDFIDEANAFSLQILFVNAIKRRMNELSMTQKTLSIKLGVNPSFLSGVFNGNKLLNLKHIAKMERILGISASISFETLKEKGKSSSFDDDYYPESDNASCYCNPGNQFSEIEQTIRRLSDCSPKSIKAPCAA